MHEETSESEKYPLSCLYKHNDLSTESNKLRSHLTSEMFVKSY